MRLNRHGIRIYYPRQKVPKSGITKKIFKEEVRKIYNFRCARCGSTSGLQVHHIKPKWRRPDLSVEPTNGILLCDGCHRREHER